MAEPTLTYTLTNGNTADASQVMQNFNDLLNGITDGAKDLEIMGLTVAGAASIAGNTTVGDFSSDDLTVNASLATTLNIKTNDSYDVGSALLGLRALYLGNTSGGAKTTKLESGATTSHTITLPAVVAGLGQSLVASDTSGATIFRYPDKVLASQTTTYTATLDETYIPCDATSAAFTVTLPAASTASGKKYVIKKTDTSVNAVTVDGASTETIDGALTYVLASPNDALEIICDGSNWKIATPKKIHSYQAKSADYTAIPSDETITVDASGAARTITLPAAATNKGVIYDIKKIDSSTNTVTIDGNASETIDGATTYVLRVQYQAVKIICDGSNWHALDRQRNYGSVFAHTSSGHGGGSFTKILRYSNSTVVGAALSFTDDTDGSRITVNESGVYSISLFGGRSGGNGSIGISLNTSQGTTDISSITAADRLSIAVWPAGTNTSSQSVSWRLAAGDIIRAHDDAATGSEALQFMRMVKVSD